MLRGTVDRLAAGAKASLAACLGRAVYVVEGRVGLAAAGATARLGTNDAWFAGGETGLLAARDSVLIRWELHPEGAEPAEEPQVVSQLVRPIELAAGNFLMRADRVDFPAGGVAYLHTHQGPGIRCLLTGSVRIDTEGRSHDVEPLGLWFESGPAPVFAEVSPTTATAFVRVMILPMAIMGKPSIRYVRPEDIDKPKTQRYEVFFDQPLDL